jgi:hypothetical protein
MYARVTIVQVLPGKIDEAIGIFRDSVTGQVFRILSLLPSIPSITRSSWLD